MPPKKKKAGKKSGKKKSASKSTAGPGISIADVINEVSKEFYLVQIRDLEQKIARYQEKCDKLELLNKEIQKNFDQQAHDKDEIASFLTNKVDKKSIEIIDLQGQLRSLEEDMKSEKEKYSSDFDTLKAEMKEMRNELTSENIILGDKLASLEEFRLQREELMKKSAEMEEQIKTQENNHKEQMYQLERKAVVDKDRLKKEMILRVNTVAAEFRKVSNKQMADTTKRAISENVMINSQLAKMSDKTMELISENDEMKMNEKAQQQNLEILEHNEKELMKKNAMHKKLIIMLTEKSREQEQSLEEFAERDKKYAELESEFQSLKAKFENLTSSEQSLRNERDSLKKKCELYENENNVLNEDKQYLISILADASYVIKQALQHHDQADAATTEMKNTNLLNKVVEILNVAAEMGVGINPEELASARNSHKKKKKKVYLGPLSGSGSLHGDMCRSKPEPHYNLGDLGLVPSATRVQKTLNNFHSKPSEKYGRYNHDSLSMAASKKDAVKLPLLTTSS